MRLLPGIGMKADEESRAVTFSIYIKKISFSVYYRKPGKVAFSKEKFALRSVFEKVLFCLSENPTLCKLNFCSFF